MTQYFVKSNLISNRDATPKVFTDALVDKGEKRSSEGYCQTATATDGVGSVYRMVTVPSGARVDSVKIQTNALGTGAALNCGVYYPTYIPAGTGLAGSLAGTAISASLFASAFGAATAQGITDVTNQSGTNTIQNQELPLWQAAGLSADPMMDLDICVSISSAGTAQGYIGLKVDFVK